MSALGRFLERDSVAKAVLVTILSAAALASLPTSSGPTPAHATGGTLSAPGHALVLLDIQARRLDLVTKSLAESTARCLADQGRLLGKKGVASGDAGATRAALVRRIDARTADRDGDIARNAARAMLDKADGTSPAALAALFHHVTLREACLSWAERSMDVVRASMGGTGMDLSSVRKMAERDASFVRMIARRDASDLSVVSMEAMETNAPPTP